MPRPARHGLRKVGPLGRPRHAAHVGGRHGLPRSGGDPGGAPRPGRARRLRLYPRAARVRAGAGRAPRPDPRLGNRPGERHGHARCGHRPGDRRPAAVGPGRRDPHVHAGLSAVPHAAGNGRPPGRARAAGAACRPVVDRPRRPRRRRLAAQQTPLALSSAQSDRHGVFSGRPAGSGRLRRAAWADGRERRDLGRSRPR
jgi:hypothetical protein